MALNNYLQQTQLLLHDSSGSFFSTANLTVWINQARQRTAADSECIRVLPRSSAGIASYAVTAPGAGYGVPPVVTVSAPNILGGVQATATATVLAGAVTAVNVAVAGSGYVLAPLVSFGGPGTGAAATATLQSAVQTVTNQEVYSFATFNPFVQLTPGVASILAIRQIAVYWGNLKPALAYCSWDVFNARYRVWPQFSNFPSVWSQFGQGQSGTFFFWPIPSQVLGMDLDCTCVPVDLTSDATVEAIPDPFTDAIPYRAAHLAYLYAQRYEDAQTMDGMYRQKLQIARANSQRLMVPNWYA